ncbi:DUF4190 domain-containing protein [Phycisphaeraceae bacterium D3-23]
MEQDPFTPPPPTNRAPLPLPPAAPLPPGAYGTTPIFYCITCGNTLTDATLGGQCPRCGTPTDRSLKPTAPNASPGSAVAALVLGIAAIVSCMFYGLPAVVCGILAVYFASRADSMMNSGQYSNQGRGMATAGRICGWIGLGLGLVYMVLIVIYIVFAVSMFQSMPNNPNWNQQPSQPQPWNPSGNTPNNPAVQPGTRPGGAPVEGDAIDSAINDIDDTEGLDNTHRP